MTTFKDVEIEEGSGQFLRLKDGENRIRIVSDPVPVWTVFNRVEGTAKKFLTEDAAKQEPDTKKRYAMWVFERVVAGGKVVSNELKLAEFGPQIMGGIKTIANATETAFDELPPFDLIITRTGVDLNTNYTVMASRQNTELTAEEKALILEQESVIDFLKKDAEDADKVVPF